VTLVARAARWHGPCDRCQVKGYIEAFHGVLR
jgi:hypothetical protein